MPSMAPAGCARYLTKPRTPKQKAQRILAMRKRAVRIGRLKAK